MIWSKQGSESKNIFINTIRQLFYSYPDENQKTQIYEF